MADKPVSQNELAAALSVQKDDILRAVREMLVEELGKERAHTQQMFLTERESVQQMFLTERASVQQMFLTEREHNEEFIRDAQTEILRAVEPFQKQVTIRFRAEDVRVSNLGAEMAARMEILENRLAEIEKRLLLDPPAA